MAKHSCSGAIIFLAQMLAEWFEIGSLFVHLPTAYNTEYGMTFLLEYLDFLYFNTMPVDDVAWK